MQIHEVYLHILDAFNGNKVLSEMPMSVSTEVEAYILQHLMYYFEALDVARLEVTEGSKVSEMMGTDDFSVFSVQVANSFWEAIERCEEVKSCDLICVHFSDGDSEYAGVIKLNLRPVFAHSIDRVDDAIANSIVKHGGTLPAKAQKSDEGFVLNLASGELLVKDKVLTFEGQKTSYVSEVVLGLNFKITPQKAIQNLTKAAEKVIDKYDSNPIVRKAKMKAAIENMIDNHGAVNAQNIIGQCFESHEEREAYKTEISNKGIDDVPWEVAESQKKKIKRTQKIKTSSGVEIVLPFAYVADAGNLEIVNQPDGTVWISLKNLGEII